MDANSAIGAADVGQLGAPRYLDHIRSEEHTSELQSRLHLVCRLLLEKKKILFVLGQLALVLYFLIFLIYVSFFRSSFFFCLLRISRVSRLDLFPLFCPFFFFFYSFSS